MQNLSKSPINGLIGMRYVVLSAACLCSVLMCNPASAQWTRILSLPKPKVPRYHRADLPLHVGYTASKFAELHRLQDREDAQFKELEVLLHADEGAWLLEDLPPRLTDRLGLERTMEDWESSATAAARVRSAELCRQIDAAVTKYLDQVRAIHGEAARNQEEIRLAGPAQRAKQAVWLEWRPPTPAAIGFPPQNVRHDPFSGGLISPRW